MTESQNDDRPALDAGEENPDLTAGPEVDDPGHDVNGAQLATEPDAADAINDDDEGDA